MGFETEFPNNAQYKLIMPNTRNDTATASLKQIVCIWPNLQLLILIYYSSCHQPTSYISRAAADLQLVLYTL